MVLTLPSIAPKSFVIYMIGWDQETFTLDEKEIRFMTALYPTKHGGESITIEVSTSAEAVGFRMMMTWAHRQKTLFTLLKDRNSFEYLALAASKYGAKILLEELSVSTLFFFFFSKNFGVLRKKKKKKRHNLIFFGGSVL